MEHPRLHRVDGAPHDSGDLRAGAIRRNSRARGRRDARATVSARARAIVARRSCSSSRSLRPPSRSPAGQSSGSNSTGLSIRFSAFNARRNAMPKIHVDTFEREVVARRLAPDDEHRVVHDLVDDLRSPGDAHDEAPQPRAIAAIERLERRAVSRGDAMDQIDLIERRAAAPHASAAASRDREAQHLLLTVHARQTRRPHPRRTRNRGHVRDRQGDFRVRRNYNAIRIEPESSIRE